MFNISSWKTTEKSIHESARQKQPLRRLENALLNCVNVAIPLHVELLNKHKCNIQKCRELDDINGINREQINATRTVEQLKAHIWSLDLLRNQLVEEDLPEFDKRAKAAQDLVTQAVQSFIDETKILPDTTSAIQNRQNKSIEDATSGMSSTLGDEFLQLETEQLLSNDLEKARQTEASWQHLRNELQDLNTTMVSLATYVQEQQELLNSVDQNLEAAEDNVTQGNKFLVQALKYKSAVFPVTGAVLGGCIGGPLGLFVGLKAGAAGLAVGGILGFHGGKLLKMKKTKAAEVELHNMQDAQQMNKLSSLNAPKTTSLPDLRRRNVDGH